MKKIAIVLVFTILLFGCEINSNRLERIKVSGELVTMEESFDDFTEIIIAGPFDVIIEQNGTSGMKVETHESLMQWVRSESLEDGTILLYLEDTSKSKSIDIHFDEDEFDEISRNSILSGSRLKWPDNEKNLNVVLSVNELNRIQILGESSIEFTEAFKADEFKLEVAGAVELNAEFEVNELDIEIAGAGNLNMKGEVDVFKLECAGAGTIKAYDLIANHIDLEIAGVCNAKVYALDRLDADIAGVGTVKYKGNPPVINFDKAGLGSIKSADAENEETEI